jgi:hypothetical protein
LAAAILTALGAAGVCLRLAAGPGGAAGWSQVVDLTHLPAATQRTLAVLLILPIGAAVTSFVRNVVGLQTFGTLMPNLLALSFLETDWLTGTAVFAIVMLVGLGGRAGLGRLRLLIGPRLGLVLTATVLCLVAAVSLADHLALAVRASTILLPMVVLTIIVERFYISIEETGLATSVRLLATTLAMAIVCLGLLKWQALGGLALRFPEGELFVAAVLVLIGRYCGYRLSELWRFRDLAASEGEGPK